MNEWKIIFLLLTACLAGIVTSHDCMINKQPFREDNSLSRTIGRWYGHRMIMTSQVSWNGYVLDVFDVKGEIFANSTHLLPSGECAETTTYSVESFPADKKGHKLFRGDVLGRITYFVKGSNLDVGIIYFCPPDTIKDGKCENPQVDVLSRKPTLSEKEESRVAGIIESLCLPEQTFIHKAVAFGNCHSEEPNQKVCETRFIPYFNRFEPLKAMGLWYLLAWNFPEGKGPDADDMMGVTADLKRKGQTTEGTNYNAKHRIYIRN